MPLVFEWDAEKAKNNRRKHRVSFDEACTVFDDPLAFIFLDEDHSQGEAREIIIGFDHEKIDNSLLYRAFKRSHSDHQRAASDSAGTERL
jgi:uncharacterized protein